MKKTTTKTKPKPKTTPKPARRSRTIRNAPRGAPRTIYYLLDSKGEVFDTHKSRTDAFYDAVGPRFYRGYYIVEYVQRGARRYTYQATQREVTGAD